VFKNGIDPVVESQEPAMIKRNPITVAMVNGS
jgi:hypothetical protein